jgi:transcriptional regulator with XRE-family HTH domain
MTEPPRTDRPQPSPPEWTIADRLRKARESAGLDQGELAERIGIARSTVSNYERGTHTPRRPIIRLWAEETGVPMDWLSPRTDVPLRRSTDLRPSSFGFCEQTVLAI